MFSELATIHHGRPVVEFESADDWVGPERAYRVREDWEDTRPTVQRLRDLLAHPGVEDLDTLLIGAWSRVGEETGPEEICELLIAQADRLPKLRHLFLGDITYEESELSWINQTDVSPLLVTFPQLESFRVRGGEGLRFSKVRHEHLTELTVETGGLSRGTIREIQLCEFPNLESLELLLGDTDYGFDAELDDFVPLLSGNAFPKLRRLGLMNSEIANDLAALVVNSPIVSRIEELDLSMGNLDDTGARALTKLPQPSTVKTINLTHHYLTDEGIRELRSAPALSGVELIIEDSQLEQAEDDWRPILHAE